MLDEFRRENRDRRYHLIDIVDADPATHRIVYTESRQYDARDGRLEALVTQEAFRYDVELPAATFRIEIYPPGRSSPDWLRPSSR